MQDGWNATDRPTNAMTPSIHTHTQINPHQLNRRIFLRDVSWSTTDASLREAVRPFGDVAEASVVRDRNTGKSKVRADLRTYIHKIGRGKPHWVATTILPSLTDSGGRLVHLLPLYTQRRASPSSSLSTARARSGSSTFRGRSSSTAAKSTPRSRACAATTAPTPRGRGLGRG